MGGGAPGGVPYPLTQQTQAGFLALDHNVFPPWLRYGTRQLELVGAFKNHGPQKKGKAW
jgi:hypothetical protein